MSPYSHLHSKGRSLTDWGGQFWMLNLKDRFCHLTGSLCLFSDHIVLNVACKWVCACVHGNDFASCCCLLVALVQHLPLWTHHLNWMISGTLNKPKLVFFFFILFTIHKVHIHFQGSHTIRYMFICEGLWKLQGAYFSLFHINIHMTNPWIWNCLSQSATP